MSFQNTTIDLNLAANNRTKGLVFFARGTLDGKQHYAKIVVLKKSGSYLQDADSGDPYVELLVSFQTADGVPYAKILGK